MIMVQVWNLTGVPCQTMMKLLEMNEMLPSIAPQRMGCVLQIQYVFLFILLHIYSHIILGYCDSSASEVTKGAAMGEERLKDHTQQQRPS